MPYFKSGTGNLYYEKQGDHGPAIVLLHGLGSSGRIWLRQVKELKKTFQVFVVDLPGHGQSDHIPHYSFEGIATTLHQWMSDEGIEKATLVGLSLGCTLALTMALQHPKKISGLVLEGPVGGCHVSINPLGWLDQIAFHALPLLMQLTVTLFGHHAAAHWLNTFGVKRQRTFRVLEELQSHVDFKSVRQLLWQSACPPYAGKLATLNTPTLIIRGCYDPMPRRFVRYLQVNLSATLIEIPDTRHLVAMERPRIFNHHVKSFVQHLTQ